MNEPKRRGRPPKARIEGGDVPELAEQMDAEVSEAVAVLQDNRAELARRKAQGYALRVWNGQSATAPRAWRIERVRQALEGQGMSADGITLPADPEHTFAAPADKAFDQPLPIPGGIV